MRRDERFAHYSVKAPGWQRAILEVNNNGKSSDHCYVKVDIYFAAVEMIDIPTEKEIQAMIEEIRKNPQDFKFVA